VAVNGGITLYSQERLPPTIERYIRDDERAALDATAQVVTAFEPWRPQLIVATRRKNAWSRFARCLEHK
jgi:hypothetical protein